MGKCNGNGPRPPIDTLGWGAEPPEPSKRMLKIWAAKCGRPLDVFVLSRQAERVCTHWVDGRSTPCLRPMRICEWCELGYGIRWKAYVGLFDPRDGRVALAEITLNAFNQCPALRNGIDLRGGRLKLSRPGKQANSAVTAEFYPYHASFNFSIRDLPPEFNVREALMRIWFG